uniref:BAP29/BAP31 transmembrane domain-containing protein n=1 Tax=Tetraselmis sp. GSL018 TaxID=582737 RepID=A0A061RUU3_9CHLO|mmetsp:Transcript_7918/g.18964  ORF Transcript_7918/g.18964 Transcript_7918/m.18964 type:complete len:185 (+) Transcript_7918:210-764(+)
MGQWMLIIEICLPVPAVLLCLLFLPAPWRIRHWILFLTERVMSFPLLGGTKLIHLMLLITGIALIGTTHMTWRTAESARAQLEEAGPVSPNIRLGILGQKWRQERNFWIALLCFLSWVTLYRLYHLLLKKDELEHTIRELRESRSTGSERPELGGKKAVHSTSSDTPSAPPMPAAPETDSKKKK